jgi:hypothetical protein
METQEGRLKTDHKMAMDVFLSIKRASYDNIRVELVILIN